MRNRMLSFAVGVVVGTVAATAWANYSPRIQSGNQTVAAASMSPFDMMAFARPPAAPHYDAH